MRSRSVGDGWGRNKERIVWIECTKRKMTSAEERSEETGWRPSCSYAHPIAVPICLTNLASHRPLISSIQLSGYSSVSIAQSDKPWHEVGSKETGWAWDATANVQGMRKSLPRAYPIQLTYIRCLKGPIVLSNGNQKCSCDPSIASG